MIILNLYRAWIILEISHEFYWDNETQEQPLLSVSVSEMHIPNTHGLLFSCSILGLVIVLYSAVCMDRQERHVCLWLNMQSLLWAWTSLASEIVCYAAIMIIFYCLFIILKELQFSCWTGGRLVSTRSCHVTSIRKYCPRADRAMLMNGSMKWIMPGW